MIISQLSIFVENRPGALRELTELLCSRQVNLRALNIAEATDYGVLRLIVDHTETAAGILREAGYVFSVTKVVAAAVPDCVGGLNKLLALLADAQVNIEYMYSVFGHRDGMAYMVFKVSDPEKLDRIFAENQVESTGKRELGA